MKIYSARLGFWQAKMDDDSILSTTFSCPEGHFKQIVMSFGLKNIPFIFQRKIDQILRKYGKFVLAYILIVFNKFVNNKLIISKKKI